MALTPLMWKFISVRLLSNSDKAAAEEAKISPQTVKNWKQESEEFCREYEASFTDGVHVAKEYSRKLLGKAVQRHDEAMDALDRGKADHGVRLAAGRTLLQMHGLLKQDVDITSGGKALRIVIDGSDGDD